MLLVGCASLKKTQITESQVIKGKFNFREFCDTISGYKSVFIGKIDANIEIFGDQYKTNVSLYYIPDSIFFASAVNAGFEIIRIGILKDSTVLINRLEREAYIIQERSGGMAAPIDFYDLELMINRKAICNHGNNFEADSGQLIIDTSAGNVRKTVTFETSNLNLKSFEFFQKGTGEYVVGEFGSNDTLTIYADYILNDIKIEATGGTIEYNRELKVNLEINRRKYETFYF
ncbi:MAG: DUF4292 domain-containing protein [Bacteroidales bacterium]|nr:DUF4292 domain-containing protein [Bacteroidales bacterium]